MHLSRAIVPAENFDSRKNEDKKVTQAGFKPTHSQAQGGSVTHRPSGAPNRNLMVL